MSHQYEAGEAFPPLAGANIHGAPVPVPAADGRLTHLQFRRFAACPVCNLHLQNFVARHSEVVDAGIQEVVISHSSNAELLPYQGHFRSMSSAIRTMRSTANTASARRSGPFSIHAHGGIGQRQPSKG
jgi:hypothetical protein